MGVTAAKQNLSLTRMASTRPGHTAANQIKRVFIIWHSALSSKSLLRFPQPIPSLPDVCFFNKYLTTCKKEKSHNSLGADSERWASAGSGRALSWKRDLFLSQNIHDMMGVDIAPAGFGEGRVRAGIQPSLLFTGRTELPSGATILLQLTVWVLTVWAR